MSTFTDDTVLTIAIGYSILKSADIAQAFHKKISESIAEAVRNKLPQDLRQILDKFNTTYKCEF